MTDPKDCDHTDLDHGICMDCEEDLSDHLFARAYDDAKAAKYED